MANTTSTPNLTNTTIITCTPNLVRNTTRSCNGMSFFKLISHRGSRFKQLADRVGLVCIHWHNQQLLCLSIERQERHLSHSPLHHLLGNRQHDVQRQDQCLMLELSARHHRIKIIGTIVPCKNRHVVISAQRETVLETSHSPFYPAVAAVISWEWSSGIIEWIAPSPSLYIEITWLCFLDESI